jgi:hypothetical protein
MYILQRDTFSHVLEPLTPLFSSLFVLYGNSKNIIPATITVPLRKLSGDGKKYFFAVSDVLRSLALRFKSGTPIYEAFLNASKRTGGFIEVAEHECIETEKVEYFD